MNVISPVQFHDHEGCLDGWTVTFGTVRRGLITLSGASLQAISKFITHRDLDRCTQQQQ